MTVYVDSKLSSWNWKSMKSNLLYCKQRCIHFGEHIHDDVRVGSWSMWWKRKRVHIWCSVKWHEESGESDIMGGPNAVYGVWVATIHPIICESSYSLSALGKYVKCDVCELSAVVHSAMKMKITCSHYGWHWEKREREFWSAENSRVCKVPETSATIFTFSTFSPHSAFHFILQESWREM